MASNRQRQKRGWHARVPYSATSQRVCADEAPDTSRATSWARARESLRLMGNPDEQIGIPASAACSRGSWLFGEPVVAVRRRQVHYVALIPDALASESDGDAKW